MAWLGRVVGRKGQVRRDGGRGVEGRWRLLTVFGRGDFVLGVRADGLEGQGEGGGALKDHHSQGCW